MAKAELREWMFWESRGVADLMRDAPSELRAQWEYTAPKEFPGMRTDGVAWINSLAGLMYFFQLYSNDDKPMALPSRAADSVWHVWISWYPKRLNEFCLHHFGMPIERKIDLHVPWELALARTWALACQQEGINPILPGRIPCIFAIDGELQMPGGWWFRLNSNGVELVPLAPMTGEPLEAEIIPHPGVTAEELLASGILGQEVLEAWSRIYAAGKNKTSGDR